MSEVLRQRWPCGARQRSRRGRGSHAGENWGHFRVTRTEGGRAESLSSRSPRIGVGTARWAFRNSLSRARLSVSAVSACWSGRRRPGQVQAASFASGVATSPCEELPTQPLLALAIAPPVCLLRFLYDGTGEFSLFYQMRDVGYGGGSVAYTGPNSYHRLRPQEHAPWQPINVSSHQVSVIEVKLDLSWRDFDYPPLSFVRVAHVLDEVAIATEDSTKGLDNHFACMQIARNSSRSRQKL